MRQNAHVYTCLQRHFMHAVGLHKEVLAQDTMPLKVQLDEIACSCKETCQSAPCSFCAFRPLASDRQVVRWELHLMSGWGHVAGCRMSVEEQIEKHARYLARLTEECEGVLDRYRRAVRDGSRGDTERSKRTMGSLHAAEKLRPGRDETASSHRCCSACATDILMLSILNPSLHGRLVLRT